MAVTKEKIKQFFTENEFRSALFFGLVLVAIISFEAGLILGKNQQNSPIIIEKSAQIQNLSSESAPGSSLEAKNSVQEAKTGVAGSSKIPAQNSSAVRQDCAFVGSKNSNKYHLPTCRFAKIIKPENIVCFSSAEDATAKGYLADKGCIK